MNSKFLNKLFSWLLVIAMVLSMCPTTVFAAGETKGAKSDRCLPCPHCQNAHVDTWTAWDGTGSSLASGHYYLQPAEGDTAVMTAAISIGSGKNVVIDLNGYTLQAKSADRAFVISGGGKLTIMDSSANETGRLASDGVLVAKNGGLIYMESTKDTSDSRFYLYSGEITGGRAGDNTSTNRSGGNLYIASGKAYLYGGKITNGYSEYRGGNLAAYGSYAYCYMLGDVQMRGGEVGNWGGNIYLTNTSKLIVGDNALITGGKNGASSVGGGNIKAMTGEIFVFGGKIEGTATGSKSTYDITLGASTSNAKLYVYGGTIGKVDKVTDGSIYQVYGGNVKSTPATVACEASTTATVKIDGVSYYQVTHTVETKVAPTCTAAGSVTYSCAACEYSYTIELEKAGHTLTVGSSANCGNAGYETYSCTGCDYFHECNKPMPATGDHTLVLNSDKTKYECSICDYEEAATYCDKCGTVPESEWQDWNGGKLAAGGHYRLTGDLALEEAISISSGRVCIDLGGHTVTAAAGKRAFAMTGSSTHMTLMNGSIVATASETVEFDHGGLLYISGGTANLYKLTISGGKTVGSNRGGNIYTTSADVKLTDCIIHSGRSYRGGNIAGYGTGTLVICGDTKIYDGTATYGNNLYTGQSVSLTVFGGEFGNTGTSSIEDICLLSGSTPINHYFYGGTVGKVRVYGSNDYKANLYVYGGRIKDLEHTDSADKVITTEVVIYNATMSENPTTAGWEGASVLAPCADYCKDGDVYKIWHKDSCTAHSAELGKVAEADKNSDSHGTWSDATCTTKATCPKCGQTKDEINSNNHAPNAGWEKNETHHWHKCDNGCTAELNKAAHDWVQTGSTAGNCQTNSTISYKCSVCEATKTETGAKGDHSWSTTLTQGETTHYYGCTIGGCSEKKDVAEHSYTYNAETGVGTCVCGATKNCAHDWVQTGSTAGDCQTNSTISYKCSVCEATKTVNGAKGDHSWSTTLTQGETTHYYVCTIDGCSEKKDVAEHSYTYNAETGVGTCVCGATKNCDHDWVQTGSTAGNCQTNSTISYKCSVCEATKTETGAKGDHSWSTTLTQGETTHYYGCTIGGCSERKDEAEHNYATETERVGATCTEDGYVTKACACGKTETTTIKATGHTEETITGKDATCTETGLTEGKKCTVCGTVTVEQEEIKALGHAEETVYGTPATCTEPGKTNGKVCSRCGETLVPQTEIPKLEHELIYQPFGNGENKHFVKCNTCETVSYEENCVDANGDKECDICHGVIRVIATVVEVDTLEELLAALADNSNDLPILITAKIVIPGARSGYVLDLNGKTINAAWENEAAGKHIYVIENYGNLTITGNGVINTRGIFNYGTLTLNGGTINAIDGNGGYAVRNYSGSTFIMNGGTIATTYEDDNLVDKGGYDATTVRVDEGAEFTMNGGTINNICDYTFAIENHGTTTVKAGTISSVHTTVANYGDLIIEGGSFTCNGLQGVTAQVIWAAEGTTTITGGTFDGKDNYNGFNVNASEGADVAITGGTFLSVHSGSLYGEGEIAVSGGTFFDKIPADRLADGYDMVENADGTYGAAAHVHSYTTSVTAPTCTEKGYTTYTCACGDTYKGNYVDANGHAYIYNYNGNKTHAVTCEKCDFAATENCADNNADNKCDKCNAVIYVAPTVVEVDTLEELLAALADNSNDLPIVVTAEIKIPAGATVVLDLNGKTVTSVYQTNSTSKHIYPLNVYGNLTIQDTKGNGSISGRGIFVQAGSKLTMESGSIYAIDSNGGSALYMYGGDVVINGGHIEQKAEGTYNFAIQAPAGCTVTVNGGWVGGNHGAIAATGGQVVINGGTLVCTGSAGMTDNVVYTSGAGSITINGGNFIADNDGPAGGACVYDANGGVTINGGTFGNSSGGDVWGTTGTTIKGGTFENLIEKQHIADGYELNENGTVVKSEVEYALAGSGTQADPYQIGSVEDLIFFRDSVNAGETKYNAAGMYFVLTADIDLAGINWVGIGSATAAHGFMGNFDGNGFVIKNLTITNPALDSDGYAYAGLFAVTEGVDKDHQNIIKNLIIENVTISTTGHIVAAAIAYPYYTIVDNVTVRGNIAITGGNYTAGVLAYTRRCVNASNLSVIGNAGSYITGAQTVGGVISDIQTNGGLVVDYANFSVENVAITGTKQVGGIAGIIATQTIDGVSVKNVTLSGSSRVGIIAGAFGGPSTIIDATYANVTGATAIIGGTYNTNASVEAKIGNTYYATLADAIAAAQAGDTITLVADLALSEVVLLDKSVTIDGNGHTLKSSASRIFRVTASNVEVTMNNLNMVSEAVRVGTNDVRGISVDVGLSNVKLTLNNCSVEFTDASANDWAYAVNICSGGNGHTLTINGGSYEGANVINVYGANNTVIVKDATLTATYPINDLFYGACIWVQQNQGSSVTATGNTFNGSNAMALNLGTGTALDESNNTYNAAYVVAKIGNEYFYSLEAAAAAAQAGDTIVLLQNVTLSAKLTLPADITLNGNGKQINGEVWASGDLTFAGHTKITTFNAGYNKPVITIGAGACLEITGTGRMVIGHGATFNITGTITDAKTADKTAIQPSLIVAAGASFTGAGLNFNVTNAYIKFNGNATSKNSNASATFNFNVENSIWEQTGVLAFYVPTNGMDPTFNFNLTDSVLTSTSHLVFDVTKGEIVFDNSNVNVGVYRQLENRGTLKIVNGSVVWASVQTSSNAKNPGTTIVDNATYVTTGTFGGSDLGTGKLILKNNAVFSTGTLAKVDVTIDATIDASEFTFTKIEAATATFTLEAGATLTAPADLTVTTVEDYKVVYANGVYTSVARVYIAEVNGDKCETLADIVDTIKAYSEAGIDAVVKFYNDITINKDQYKQFAYGTGNIIFTADAPVTVTLKADFDFVNGDIQIKVEKNVTLNVYDNAGGIYVFYGPGMYIEGTIGGGQNWGCLYLAYGKHTVAEDGKLNIGRVHMAWTELTVNGEIDSNYLLVEESTLILDGALVDANYITDTNNGGLRYGASKIFMINGSIVKAGTMELKHANSVLTMDLTASLTANKVQGAGKIVIDVAGFNGNAVEIIKADMSGFTGTVELINNDNYAVCEITSTGVIVKKAVAAIGNAYYATLAEALAAAQDGDTITLIWSAGDAPIAMNGAVYGKSVTITGTATVDWSKGNLFVGRGGAGNGTVIFDNANLTSASNNASYGIHVSGREKNTTNKFDGTLIIKNSAIELDYLINKGTITLDNSTLTVKNGFAIGGRPASETESGADATATITLTNGSKLVVNNHNGMGLGYEAIGVMNIEEGSTFECTQAFLVTAKGTMNIAGTAVIAGKLTNNGKIVLTDVDATLTATAGLNVTTDLAGYDVIDNNGTYTVAQIVAMVGDKYYTSIDEAIANWTNGTTLTLLADVTLTDVIVLKSTEHHILNLGQYTMTAASGKNAIVIKACGTGSAERTAITINADATNPGGINAGSKSVIYYKYADGGISTEDRPIIKINGGVFTGATSSFGTAGIYTIGTAARKCATLNISGGTFNCSINGSGKSKLLISGGTFNYSVGSQGDSTALRLISGGKFKTIGFMTADSNNTKFWFGTSMANSNVGIYVDDEGYIVVGGPVITEPGNKFAASSTNYAGASSYLQYSSVKANGLYYTSLAEALADNNKTTGNVTVYLDSIDLTGITYKGTLTILDETTVIFAEGAEPEVAAVEGMALSYTETVANGVVTRIYKVFKPVAEVEGQKFPTVQEALQFAIDNNATELKILCDVREQMITDFELILNADLTITADAPVKVEFYNKNSSYDFVVGSNNHNTLTIDENVHFDLTDRVIWLGYYGNNVDVTVKGYLGGYQIWHGADTLVYGTLDSHGEALVMRRNATMTVRDGGVVNANYFQIYSGHIVGKNATINAGLVWINNNHSYGSEGTVSIALDNTDFNINGEIKVNAGAGKTAPITLVNGSDVTAAGALTLGAGASVLADESSSFTAKGKSIFVAKANGYQYTTLAAAIAAANGGTVEILCDVEENLTAIENVTLITNVAGGVTVKSTYDDYVDFNNVTLGAGVTLDAAKIFSSGADTENVIEGTLKAGTLYNAYDATMIVRNGGKIVTTGMIVNRYHTDANAGIYVYGDGDNTTVEVSCGDTIGTYSGTFYAEDAVINGNMLWIDYLKGSTQEADKYAQSTPIFENSVVNITKELRLYKDATLTLTDSTVTAGTVQVRENADPTVTMNNSTIKADAVLNLAGATINAKLNADNTVTFVKMQAKIGNTTYASLLDALAAAQDGETVVMLQDVELYTRLIFSLYTNGKNVTLDGNGFKLYASSTNWGTGNGKHLINVNCDNVTLKNIVLDSNKIAEGANIYMAQNITFENVSIINKKGWNADLTVNGSTLNVAGTLSASYVDVSLGKGVTTPLGITAEDGAVLDVKTLQIASAGYPNTNLDGALSTDGTSYYTFKKLDANGNLAGYANNLSRLSDGYSYALLEDATVKSNVTLLNAGHAGKLITNGHTMTIADGKTLTVNGELTIEGTGTIAGDIILGNTTATLTAPEGLNVTTNVADHLVVYANGTYSVAKAVVKNATTGELYQSLAEAIAAVQNGETIVLLEDNAEKVTINQVSGKSFTIDGNGKTMTGKITVKGRSNDAAEETLLIKNLNFVTDVDNHIFIDATSGKVQNLTVENCTFTGTASYVVAVKLNKTGNTTVRDCTADGVYYLVYNTAGGNNLTVEDCTANSSYGIRVHSCINATIKNVELTTSYQGIIIDAGSTSTLSLENVKVTTTHAEGRAPVYVNGSAASVVTIVDKGGNTFTANAGMGWLGVAKSTQNVKVISDNASVADAKCLIAKIGNTYYNSLALAIEEAQDGETITLVNDFTVTSANTVLNSSNYATLFNVAEKAVTIDLNGKTINVEAAAADLADEKSAMLLAVFSVDTNGTLILKDSVGNGGVNVKANDAIVYSLATCYGQGGELVIEGGNYTADVVNSSLIYAQYSDVVTVNGGKFILGNLGTSANGSPWIFNVKGQNTGHINVNGGTFNADVAHQHWEFEVSVPKEKAVKNNGDGTWTIHDAVAYVIEKSTSSSGYVNYVGYATLEEAIAAAQNGETVVLLTDIETSETFTIPADKSITLDLNGKKITGTDKATGSYQIFANYGELTITGDGEITLSAENERNTAYYSAVIGNFGKLTIAGGKLTHTGGTKLSYVVDNNSTSKNVSLTVKGGELHSAYTAIRQFLNSTVNTNDLLVEGGKVTSNGTYAVSVQNANAKANKGSITVTGGEVGKVYVYSYGEDSSNIDVWMNVNNVAGVVAYLTGETVENIGGFYTKAAAVAQNGKFFYSSLQAAIDDAYSGETIKLLKDIELTEGVVVPADLSITLDLNGKTVSMETADNAKYALILNKGNLTITGDGKLSYKYTGTNSSDAYNTIETAPGSVLTVKNGTIENLSENCLIAYAIDGLTNGNGGDVTVNIEGGKISSKKIAVRIFANSTTNTGNLNISGGEISGRVIIQSSNASANKAALNITGGTITTNGYKADVLYIGGSGNASGITASVSGGTFNGEILSGLDKGFISGGIFSEPVAEEFCAAGYIPTENADGTYGVKIGKFVARVNGVGYETLAEAFAAAEAGDTIVLVEDIELTETLVNTKKVTLDLNGKTISGTDTTNKSFSLITNKGELTITDSVGNGKITLEATQDNGYSRSSSVISNTVGGKLIVESGLIEHLGGHTMAYAIDNLTNGKGTYAETVINGGTIKSSYVGIRQFLNGVDADNILTVNGGTVTGNNTSIFFQDPSANCNSGKLTVGDGATLGNRVYISGTAGTPWNVEVAISAQALGTNGIVTDEIPETSVIKEVSGVYRIVEAVASVNGIGYATLAEAIAAAQAGETVKVLTNITLTEMVKIEKEITLDLNGKTITANCRKAIEVYADATITNGTIIANERCVDTRKAVELNLTNVNLLATQYKGANQQPLTIGGSENGTVVNLNNVTIDAGTQGYAIITFVETEMNVVDSNISGYMALYVKDGSEGSEFNFENSTLTSDITGNDVTGNATSIITVEADDITVNVTGGKLVAKGNNVVAIDLKDVTGAELVIKGDIDAPVILNTENVTGNTVAVMEAYENQLKAEGYVTKDYTVAGMVEVAAVAVAQNVQTGETYDDVQVALNAAKNNETVKLLQNVTVDYIFVGNNKTLDLNGKTLTAGYVAASFAGSNIIDSTNGTGLLVAAASTVSLSKDNKQLAVQTSEGIRFINVVINEYENRQTAGAAKYYFYFNMAASKTILDDILANGSEGTGIVIRVRATWTSASGTKMTQYFEFSSEDIKAYAANWDTKEFRLNLTGLENVTDLDLNAEIVSTIGNTTVVYDDINKSTVVK